MARTAANGADTTAAQIEAINAQLAELSKSVETLAGTQKGRITAAAEDIRARAGSEAARLKDRAGEEAQRIQAQAAEMGERARESAHQAYAAAEDHVRKQPAMALGIAAGVGFLVGLLATRR
ncbi:MAG: hypothetical protein AAGF60_07250 [Pseudomonadota bacterium]